MGTTAPSGAYIQYFISHMAHHDARRALASRALTLIAFCCSTRAEMAEGQRWWTSPGSVAKTQTHTWSDMHARRRSTPPPTSPITTDHGCSGRMWQLAAEMMWLVSTACKQVLAPPLPGPGSGHGHRHKGRVRGASTGLYAGGVAGCARVCAV